MQRVKSSGTSGSTKKVLAAIDTSTTDDAEKLNQRSFSHSRLNHMRQQTTGQPTDSIVMYQEVKTVVHAPPLTAAERKEASDKSTAEATSSSFKI